MSSSVSSFFLQFFFSKGLLEEGGGRPETTDLLPQMGSTKGGLQLHCAEFPDLNASPLPELSSPLDADVPTAAETPKSAAQLTVFYAGRVVVFDHFPADKAKELMLLASQACSQDARASPIKEAPPISSAPDAGSLPFKQHNPALPWSNPSSPPPSPSPARRLADASGNPLHRQPLLLSRHQNPGSSSNRIFCLFKVDLQSRQSNLFSL